MTVPLLSANPATPLRADITGVVLAGGRGTRMGGVDKGLQPWHGRPLALHALERLAPQVGALLVNANRHLDAYAAFGVPVCPDATGDHAGPLAGWLAALQACRTPWLVTVPCDSPNFPLDLAGRLAAAVSAEGASLAMAACVEGGDLRTQPVFCLLRASLKDSLARYLAEGGRKVDRWTAQHGCVTVTFADGAAFANANTVEELQRLQAAPDGGPIGR
ncbi:MAG: molybdenum cofactor guanylyltransferase MobA [Rubrivivax sp.]|nr:molybdenum cofactor guanylyltransferase MobA [Rubrivivax sp.]